MIVYKINVMEALKEKGYNTTRLRRERLLSESTIQSIRQGRVVSLLNLDRLCQLLDCDVGDILTSKEL